MQHMNFHTLAHCANYFTIAATRGILGKKVYHHLNFCNRGEKEAADTWDFFYLFLYFHSVFSVISPNVIVKSNAHPSIFYRLSRVGSLGQQPQ